MESRWQTATCTFFPSAPLVRFEEDRPCYAADIFLCCPSFHLFISGFINSSRHTSAAHYSCNATLVSSKQCFYRDSNGSKMEMSTVIVNTWGFKESHRVSFERLLLSTEYSAGVLLLW